jgi:hypothetical protein
VELNESERKCPLCDTVVINPNVVFDEKAEPVFPNEQFLIDLADNRKMTALLVSVILAIPMSICLVVNLSLDHAITWSMIVAGAIFMLWSFIVPPLLLKNLRLMAATVIDTAAMLAFLYLLNIYLGLEERWYLPLAVPIVLCLFAFFCINIAVVRNNKIGKLYMAAVVFITIGALLVAVEVIIDMYTDGKVELIWSLITMIPCALLSLLYVIIEKKKSIKENLRKKLQV